MIVTFQIDKTVEPEGGKGETTYVKSSLTQENAHSKQSARTHFSSRAHGILKHGQTCKLC